MTAPSAPAPAELGELANTPAGPSNPTQRRRDDFEDYPRDQWKRPLILQLHPEGHPDAGQVVQVTGKEGPTPLLLPYTRASRMGGALEYEGALNSYHVRNAVIGVIGSEPLLFLARSFAEPGGGDRREFDKQIVKPAQEASGANVAAQMGIAMHGFCEKHDRGEHVPDLGRHQPLMDAYRALVAGWRWEGIETRLICDRWRAAGKTDRLGRPPGWMVAPDGTVISPDDIVCLDIKTSSSDRYFGVKFAVQLAIYAHGDRYDLETGKRTPTGCRTDWALVVHIPTGGTSGALYWVNIRRGAELVSLARQVLDAQGERGLVTRALETGGGAAGHPMHHYATEQEAREAAALITGGQLGFPPEPEPDAEEHDPEPSTAAEPSALEVATDHAAASAGPVQVLEDAQAARATTVPDADEHDPEPSTALDVPADPGIGGVVQRDQGPPDAEQEDGPLPAGGPVTPVSTSTVPDSVTAGIRPDLGAHLQAQADPARKLQRELDAIRTAPPRGALDAIRERYAASWTPEHEAAAGRRAWELEVLTNLEAAASTDTLTSVWAQVDAWGAWTEEMGRVAARRWTELDGRSDD